MDKKKKVLRGTIVKDKVVTKEQTRKKDGASLEGVQEIAKEASKGAKVVILVDSVPIKNDKEFVLNIQNGTIYMPKKGISTNTNNVLRKLQAGVVLIFQTSIPWELVCHVDMALKMQMIDKEACGRMMILFFLWMVNTLPASTLDHVGFLDSMWYEVADRSFTKRKRKRGNTSLMNFFQGVDVSNRLFTFLPVVRGYHWTLYVVYNPAYKKLPRLPNHLSLIYFDPMGHKAPKRDIPHVHRAMECLLEYASSSNIANGLKEILKGKDLTIMPAPEQPNDIDCGFYVMAYMKYLIDGGFGENPPEKWLSKDWFTYNDVTALRKGLNKWVNNIMLTPLEVFLYE